MNERSHAEALLLLPGLLCDAALWEHQRRHLGECAGPISVADLARDDSVAAMAEGVLAQAPARFALAGLSMGGYVAFEIMRRAPDRVSRLALFDTSARPDTPEQTARRRGLMELAEKGQFKGVTPRLLPLLVHPERVADPPLAGAVMAMAERVGQAAFLRQQRAIMGRPDSRPGLEAIRCPTLVVAGRQDALTPPALAEEIAAGIPGARYVPIEDCGHLATMEQPQAATALMRLWLTG
ncbi:MAG: alpha/beta fold hydrolase [Alphaproteobacteria bacterium]|nr:alpha/beta fold hydrolase [Alphaproteobacteria bacterium]